VYLGVHRVRIKDNVAREVQDADGELVYLVGRTPFDQITSIDTLGDPDLSDDRRPHIVCRFGWRGRRLYEAAVVYRTGHLGTLLLLEGVIFRHEKVSRRQRRRIEKEWKASTRGIRDQAAKQRKEWLEGPSRRRTKVNDGDAGEEAS
jgi:hypothetical protein